MRVCVCPLAGHLTVDVSAVTVSYYFVKADISIVSIIFLKFHSSTDSLPPNDLGVAIKMKNAELCPF